ncbi:MAG: formamidopyrimidine-DNA glycosylase [Planctomycetaceae bacterium]
MPELPEVETMVRGIRPFVEGREIVSLKKCRCTRKPIAISPGFRQFTKRVVGTTVTEVRRLAKRVVFHLSSNETIVIEPRMTGLMLLSDPPTSEHLRLEWQFAGRKRYDQLWFWDRRGLGTVRLYKPDEFDLTFERGKLGPDALCMTKTRWSSCLSKTQRAIKVALLDQKLVAGIGNLYASEILHVARLHPAVPACHLTDAEIGRLSRAVKSVLTTAIRYEGSTLNDATYRNALNRSGSYQNHHRVYARAGEACPRCRSVPVQRIVQAQRSTFFCPGCQISKN